MEIERFLTAIRTIVEAGALPAALKTRALDGTGRLLAAARGSGPEVPTEPADLPVARHHFVPALARARSTGGPVAELAAATAALAPLLAWRRRAGSTGDEGSFFDGHANATVIGPGWPGAGDSLRAGISLLAPHQQYPDHRHPPEEIYVVLSPGAWRQDDGPWREPGIGGYVHNPPDIVHAMRSGDAPLLAVWCLWPAATS